MGKDEDTRGFLMRRFDDKASKWPEVSMVCDKYDSGMEICILSAEGQAPNLKGKEAPTRAVLILSTAKKKLFLLRLYAWPTEFDAEGLKGDLDMIEMGFDIPDLRPEPEKDEPPPRPAEDEEEPEDAPEGDEAEEKVFEDKLVGWKIVKPVGIKSSETYDKEKFGDVVVWFEDNDHVGSYQIHLLRHQARPAEPGHRARGPRHRAAHLGSGPLVGLVRPRPPDRPGAHLAVAAQIEELPRPPRLGQGEGALLRAEAAPVQAGQGDGERPHQVEGGGEGEGRPAGQGEGHRGLPGRPRQPTGSATAGRWWSATSGAPRA